jgi:hypothetical protein
LAAAGSNDRHGWRSSARSSRRCRWRWRSWRRSTALSSATKDSEQENREIKAASGRLILLVRAMTREKRAEAESILRNPGATSLNVV